MNKNVTSPRQSEYLWCIIGLNKNTADYYYSIDDYDFVQNLHPISNNQNEQPDYNQDMPCWSLDALIGLLPKQIENYELVIAKENETTFFCQYAKKPNIKSNYLFATRGETELVAVFEMFVLLHEGNNVPKEIIDQDFLNLLRKRKITSEIKNSLKDENPFDLIIENGFPF